MVFDPIRLGERLHIQRRRQGLTTQQLADKAGVSPGTVSNLENAKTRRVSVEVLVKLSEALGCTVDELLGETGSLEAAGVDTGGTVEPHRADGGSSIELLPPVL